MSKTRMAGEKLKYNVSAGQGCATEPGSYPPKPRGGFSHGPSLIPSVISEIK